MNAPSSQPRPERSARSRAGQLARRLTLAALCALVAGEIGARVLLGSKFVQGAHTGPPQALGGQLDPDLGWTLRPNQDFQVAGAGFRYSIRTNSRGFRDSERSFAKPAGLKRVAVLGDSTAFGWGVDQDKMWSAQLQGLLGQGVEVLNFAVPGYSTDQELWLLEHEVVRYDVDLVLLGVVLNDVLGNDNPLIHDMRKAHWVKDEQGQWMLTDHPVPGARATLWTKLRHARRSLARYVALAKLPDRRMPRHVRTPLDEPGTSERLRRVFDGMADSNTATGMLLERFGAACQRQDAPLVAFVIPHQHDRYLYDIAAKRTETEPFDGTGEFTTYATRVLQRAGAAAGFQVVSIDAALLEETKRATNLDCGDEHLNARGNQVVALALEAVVQKSLE